MSSVIVLTLKLAVPPADASRHMTQNSSQSPRVGHFHAVQFYQDAKALCGIVGTFLAEGLEKGDPAIMIATPEHTREIEACFTSRGLDVSLLRKRGDLTVLDAANTLTLFMQDGVPNPSAFRHSVGAVVKQICDNNPNCTPRAYGKMVDVLWKDGLEAAAIRLETLWNQLANSHQFKLLCGSSMGNFYKGPALDDIKAQHSRLTSELGSHAPIQ